MLAVRTFLVGTKQGADLKNLMQDPRFENLFSQNEDVDLLNKGGYATICALETKTSMITLMDIEQCTRLVQVMKRLSFFEESNTPAEDIQVNTNSYH